MTTFGNIVKSLHLVCVRIQGLGRAKSHLNTTIPRIAFFLLHVQLFLFHLLPPTTHLTSKRSALYIHISSHRPHILRETKARGPFGAALISLALCLQKCICYLLPCPRVPLLFPIAHCLLGTVPAKVFSPIYLLLFPWELYYA